MWLASTSDGGAPLISPLDMRIISRLISPFVYAAGPWASRGGEEASHAVVPVGTLFRSKLHGLPAHVMR